MSSMKSKAVDQPIAPSIHSAYPLCREYSAVFGRSLCFAWGLDSMSFHKNAEDWLENKPPPKLQGAFLFFENKNLRQPPHSPRKEVSRCSMEPVQHGAGNRERAS
eukprot:1140474-Pelagomonas_calceolata.AAC.3